MLFVAGCGSLRVASFQPPTVSTATPWTDQVFRADPNNFQFAIVSDRTGGSRPGVFEKTVTQLNLLQPEFVICVGDLIDGYTQDQKELDRQYSEIDEMLSSLEMRFFRVVGNHDISNPVMLEAYRKRYGLPYYHFLYKNVLFLIVSTEDEDESACISSTQIAYVQKTIKDNKDVRWIFVFMHKPLFIEKFGYLDQGWAQIEEALSGRPHTVFAGHWHNYGNLTKYGQNYIHLATTGGGSKLRGVDAGEFDHIVWVTMTKEGPIIANLMQECIYDKNIRPVK
jgi:hypothetical protein